MVRLLVSSFVKDTATKTRPIKVLLYYKLHHFIDWLHLILKRGLSNRFHLHCIIVAFPQYLSCELLAIPAKYGIRSQAFAFQKNSPYLELFNYYLKAMDESGISDRILERYKPQAQYCPDKSGQPIGNELAQKI